ncbi:hypothetical protein CK203_093986 [Vitis vinifera]|uniref:Reverse transcriptase/retrotransposon-derived protein RNase H-like domain-containing protein n=1 Tax=Vitis vinifera TaxID=29760 RepID=A0A438CKC3_VITVI|nr:hypothetical protein CK203_093986 [Vitis vinifera]
MHTWKKTRVPVVISSALTIHQEDCLLEVLRRCKKAIGWQISDLKGINPLVCTHHIYMEDEAKPVRQPQRRLNPHMQEVVRAEVLKLSGRYYYPISDSPWVSPTQVVPKKSGITVVQNDKGEDVSTRLTIGWRVLERVSGHPFYCFLDGYSGSCSEPCIEKDLVLNWEKCHFMVHQGIVLGHIISKQGIEVDKAKVELIVKLPSPTNVKGVRQFLGHAGSIGGLSRISLSLQGLFVNYWAPNWQLPFEVMCDASDFAIGVVLGQREDGKPYVIYYEQDIE